MHQRNLRPDPVVGMCAFPGEQMKLCYYFGNFLLPRNEAKKFDKALKSIVANEKKAFTKVEEPN